MCNPFRDWLTSSLKLVLVTLKEELEQAELTLKVTPGEISLIEEELKTRMEKEIENDL